LLDRARKPALVRGADASQTAGRDLATLGYELLQQAHVTVGNCLDLLDAELANLLATEELAAAGATGARATSARAARPT
jgi:hypothetical protein